MSMSLLSIKHQCFSPPVRKSGPHLFSWAVGAGRACRGLGVILWVLVLPGTDGGLASGPLPLGIAGDGSGFFLSVQSEC